MKNKKGIIAWLALVTFSWICFAVILVLIFTPYTNTLNTFGDDVASVKHLHSSRLQVVEVAKSFEKRMEQREFSKFLNDLEREGLFEDDCFVRYETERYIVAYNEVTQQSCIEMMSQEDLKTLFLEIFSESEEGIRRLYQQIFSDDDVEVNVECSFVDGDLQCTLDITIEGEQSAHTYNELLSFPFEEKVEIYEQIIRFIHEYPELRSEVGEDCDGVENKCIKEYLEKNLPANTFVNVELLSTENPEEIGVLYQVVQGQEELISLVGLYAVPQEPPIITYSVESVEGEDRVMQVIVDDAESLMPLIDGVVVFMSGSIQSEISAENIQRLYQERDVLFSNDRVVYSASTQGGTTYTVVYFPIEQMIREEDTLVGYIEYAEEDGEIQKIRSSQYAFGVVALGKEETLRNEKILLQVGGAINEWGPLPVTPGEVFGEIELLPFSREALLGNAYGVTGDLDQSERTVRIDVSYSSPFFAYFDVYIINSGTGFKERCLGSTSCRYINGNGKLNSPNIEQIYITSDPGFVPVNSATAITLLPPIPLENEQQYDVYVLPVSPTGVFQSEQALEYRSFTSDGKLIFDNSPKQVTIQDNKPPHPLLSIQNPFMRLRDDGELVLDYEKVDDDVTGVFVALVALETSAGVMNAREELLVDSSGAIFLPEGVYGGDVVRMEVELWPYEGYSSNNYQIVDSQVKNILTYTKS